MPNIESAIRHYLFRREQCQSRAIDACVDAAEYWGIPVPTLAAALLARGIADSGLSLLA
jgi:hypothetical protein